MYTLPDGKIIGIPLMPENHEYAKFKWLLTQEEHDTMIELLGKVQVVCDQINITCIMNAGTLLGSYRHLDIIPWDDDVDILYYPLKDVNKLFHALEALSPEYGVGRLSARQEGLKFFHNIKSQPVRKQWRFPFVDFIPLEDKNETHVRNYYFKFKVFAKDTIWPTRKRQLGKIMFDAPNDVEKFLKRATGKPYMTKCKTHFWSHRLGVQTFKAQSGLIECSNLINYFPFVDRISDMEGRILAEHLNLGGKFIYTKLYNVVEQK